MNIIFLRTIFDFFNAIFLLILIFAVLFIIIVILIVLKLMKTNVNKKISKNKKHQRILDAKIANLESIPVKIVSEKKTCSYCGAIMDGKAIYCENCGSKLTD
jgi:transposase